MLRNIAAGLVLIGLVSVAAIARAPSSVDVRGQVGQFATAEGVVDEVYDSRKATFIDLGGRYPNNVFTAVIWSEDADKFPAVDALRGKKVVITGLLTLYNGRKEIILRDAGQLKVE
ncbi:MAG: hypothetical protein J0I26_06855 [Alphaproteobacteria bacterium]|jgi:hypothetical protein|nr:hypothetical protein [Alphaproteobacteria bacterium]MBN9557235.1 hypothetical protein [Alphaproteobacteria bacterium]MBN9567677.1 hypothetical protein [Alphaproteobacteria bacterium]OJU57874.1 MAG: hypothetical protein BGO00_02585 [Alphaproteobacteria bacterium 62-8]